MIGVGAYEMYMAMKLHFNSDKYDFIKYKGKVKVSIPAFNKHKSKWAFIALERKYPSYNDLLWYMVSQFANDPSSMWIGKMVGKAAEKVYQSFIRKQGLMFATFEKDLSIINSHCMVNDVSFESLFISVNSASPKIFTMTISEDINIETFIILERLIGFVSQINEDVFDPILWEPKIKLWKNYDSFVIVDVEKCRKSLNSKFF